MIKVICLLFLALTGCQTGGVVLASSRGPAHLRFPFDADRVDAVLTDHRCVIHIVGLRSSPSIIAQGQSGHDILNGVQGIIGTTGVAIATSGIVPAIRKP